MCFLAMKHHTVRKTSKKANVLNMNNFFFAFIADVITVRDCTVDYNNTP